MKNAYIICGKMGVRKTTAKGNLDNSVFVFLYVDWYWGRYPFQLTKEAEDMVIYDICYVEQIHNLQ